MITVEKSEDFMELLFWPFIITSLLISILAIMFEKPIFLMISSILISPLSIYLSATPQFGVWILLFPLFYIGAAISLAKKWIWLSILLIVPNCILIGWLVFIVYLQ